PWYNEVGGNNVIINKIISLNPSANSQLQFNHTLNFLVDSVFSRGDIGVNFGTLNHFNYVWTNRDIGMGYGSANHFNYVWVNQDGVFSTEDQDTIMSMAVGGNLTFSYPNGNHFIHDLTVGGNLTIYQGQSPTQQNSQTFDSCSVNGNATILSGSNHLG